MRPAARRALVVWLVLAPALGTASCGAEPPAADPEVGTPASSALGTRVLSLDFDDLGALEVATGLGEGNIPLRNDTSQPVTVRIATVAGGSLRAVQGRDGGYAVRFPSYSESDPRRAVLSVSTTSADPFGPGVADFSFGADFMADEVGQGDEGGREGDPDNGNNLVQRGLFADPSQYKLQMDHGHVSCRVVGAEGEVIVRSPQVLAPDTWYRASCIRSGDRITLQIVDFESGPQLTTEVGPTGSIQLPPTTPVVLGGKAGPDGAAITRDSDQFNGAIDNVYLTIDDDT